MSKRKRSSPYPHAPSEFVRTVMRDGWRRCDAEALAMVAFCIDRAREIDDPRWLATLARHATDALAREPVLAAAVLRLASKPGVDYAVWRLLRAAPLGRKDALFRLREAAAAFEAVADEDDAEWPA